MLIFTIKIGTLIYTLQSVHYKVEKVEYCSECINPINSDEDNVIYTHYILQINEHVSQRASNYYMT